MAKKTDFFVSYNHADRFWAAGIRDWLLTLGSTVTMQATDFKPGSNFVVEMHAPITSLKELGEQRLQALAKAMKTRRAKPKGSL